MQEGSQINYDAVESKAIDPLSFHAQIEQDKREIAVFQDEIAPKDPSMVLKALFNKIRTDMGLPQDLQRLFIEYMIDSSPEGSKLSTEKRVQERASINKNFFQNATMTWKKFVAGMKLLRILRFRISVTAVHGNGRTTEHGLWIKLRDPDQYDTTAFDPVRTAVIRRADGQSAAVQHAWTHSGVIPTAPPNDLLKGLVRNFSDDASDDAGNPL